jgi:hypothetical protein
VARSAWLMDVRIVTAVTLVSGRASDAAATIAGPPNAWTVSRSGSRCDSARAARATVVGMSCNLRSRNSRHLGAASRTWRTPSTHTASNSSRPIFRCDT